MVEEGRTLIIDVVVVKASPLNVIGRDGVVSKVRPISIIWWCFLEIEPFYSWV